ncbi:MAG: PfkB family carbohydrate kinase [Candidatus Omnitrophica bacterium]|jgi:sugar/nucleoside kinase (ribokinase family)|nr:PfkB family carbohydrate kinase [Candidatus Omnitrophota bacterium]MDD4012659.1 PfkB family carbohydrate kinase [Candidatus Omnitrophota bacterium]
MRLTVIGSVALDTIETPSAKKKEILGGSATYASFSASFFAPVSVISVVGKDFPVKYVKMLRSRGVDTTGLVAKPGQTFRWKARYDKDLGHAETLGTELGVFQGFEPRIPRTVTADTNLLLANIDPELQSYIFHRLKPKGLVACDTMNHWISGSRKALIRLLKKVDIFLLNDAEARMLSGEKNLLEAARFCASKGARMVVIKKGEHGALFFSKGLEFMVPAYLLENIVDPTGAGDTFAGGMLGYLSSKRRVTSMDLRRSLVYGTIMASFAVERFAATGLAETRMSEVKIRVKQFEKLTRF